MRRPGPGPWSILARIITLASVAALSPGSVVATNPRPVPTPPTARRIAVWLREDGTCPSFLGCRLTARATDAAGAMLAETILRPRGDGWSGGHVSLEPGAVTIAVEPSYVAAWPEDGDPSKLDLVPIPSCSLPVSVPATGRADHVTGTIDWLGCSLQIDGTPLPSARVGGGAPLLIGLQADCVDAAGAPGDLADVQVCGQAIVAAHARHAELQRSPWAAAAPACAETGSCAFATFAVAFVVPDGSGWTWAAPLKVTLSVPPAVVEWPADQPLPAGLLTAQAGNPLTRPPTVEPTPTPEPVRIPTARPPGPGHHGCRTALAYGWLARPY